jgi:NAD-dependent SIR2 family protein deacetylase
MRFGEIYHTTTYDVVVIFILIFVKQFERRKSMNKKVLKVLDDFYKKDITFGDEIHFFEGTIKIIDMNYTNQFGTFILGEYIGIKIDEEDAGNRNNGKPANSDNPFEIIGTIHAPGYQNLLAGMGFYVLNRKTNKIKGYSFRETWDRLYRYGATNATASSNQVGMFFSKLIDSVDGLPSLDSTYWKKNAYDENGVPFALLSEKAENELKKGLEYAAKSLIHNRISTYDKTQIDPQQVKQLATMIKKANKITVLTGAGLSTNSGIPDYRSASLGVWKKNPTILKDLNEETFLYSPKEFWSSFYTLIKSSLKQITPFPTHDALLATIEAIELNQAHRFFSWLEKERGKDITIVTQNVDGLSQKAGNTKVFEMHGNIFTCTCPVCNKTYKMTEVLKENEVPTCRCGNVLRPDVVFFGDQVHSFKEAEKTVMESDLVLVVGTSLNVSPFNQLPSCLKDGAKIVLINGEVTENLFDAVMLGDISNICYQVKKQLEE